MIAYLRLEKGEGVSEVREEQIKEACEAYRAMIRALLQSASAPDWVELELTIAQVKALFALSDDEPATIGYVAHRLGIGLPTASHLVEKLVRGELVERTEDPKDRRRALARLTPTGEELVDRLLGGVHHLPALLRELDEDDLAAFLKGLRAAAHVAEEHAREGTTAEKEDR